jgi:hypothetical protein
MTAVRKPRGDAQLKTLSPERQRQVIDWLAGLTQAETRRRIQAEFGLSTSAAALTEFYSWWHLMRHLEQSATFAQELKRTLAELPGIRLDEEQINAAAQVAFELEAVKAQDLKAFFLLRKLRQKDKDQALDRARFQRDTCELFLQWHADAQARQIADGPASNSEKIDSLGRLMFGEEWK